MFLTSKRLLLKYIVWLGISLAVSRPLHAEGLFWQTIALVQQDLFPDQHTVPTLQEIHATTYLQRVMHERRVTQEQKDFIRNGERWLNETAKEQYDKHYVVLSRSQRQKILHVISKERWGEQWITTLLTYIMEAMLCDPVYGGNSKEVGWKWLQHHSGLPRPKKMLV